MSELVLSGFCVEGFEIKANYSLHCSVYFHREMTCHNKMMVVEINCLFGFIIDLIF